jgi:hypothetical protein
MNKFRLWLASFALGKQFTTDMATGFDFIDGQSTSPRRGTRELLAAVRTSPWLRSVVGKIVGDYAAVPWKLYAIRGNQERGQPKWIKSDLIQGCSDPRLRLDYMKQVGGEATLVELFDHPLLHLLNNPNPKMTGLQSRKVTRTHQELKGEGYWALKFELKGAKEIPVEYWPMAPHWVEEVPEPGNPFYQVSVPGTAASIQFPEDQVIPFRDPDAETPYVRGSGIGESLGQEIDTDE